jgi:hypothetical protein
MYRRLLFSLGFAALFGVPLLGAFTSPAEANHSWGGYHWARTQNPFTLKLGDNLNSQWRPYLGTASSDWNASSVLDTTIVAGGTNPRKCGATSGRVQVCNAAYGNNGWLGIASIWISGGTHITQGTVKLNDSYFNTAKYNTPAWRNMVACQEVAHTFGLDHQDETFSNTNLGSCMDYTNDPDGGGSYGPSNEHPNAHDFVQLQSIYNHTSDGSTTIASIAPSAGGFQDPENQPGDSAREWGQARRNDASGRPNVFELQLSNGRKKITHVLWVPDGQVDNVDNKDHRP